jgi:uncharacterized membrane protein
MLLQSYYKKYLKDASLAGLVAYIKAAYEHNKADYIRFRRMFQNTCRERAIWIAKVEKAMHREIELRKKRAAEKKKLDEKKKIKVNLIIGVVVILVLGLRNFCGE